jgi:4-amino-4-deoxy-L-arabinose transferase-like glycosyltransferase
MGRHKFLVLLLLVYYVGVHMLIMAASRFHVPLLPFIAVLAAYALVDRPWRESRRWQRNLAILLIVLLLANWAFEIARDWPLLSKLFGPEGHRLYIPY